jgi:hypothetical protein
VCRELTGVVMGEKAAERGSIVKRVPSFIFANVKLNWESCDCWSCGVCCPILLYYYVGNALASDSSLVTVVGPYER